MEFLAVEPKVPSMMPHRSAIINLVFAASIATSAFADTPAFEDVNAVLGMPLFDDDNLWDDPDAEVAARLGWPRESSTPRDASFRLYAKSDVRVLGARPYSLALYGEEGAVSSLSLVFANKGDVEGFADKDIKSSREAARALRSAIKDFKKQVKEDGDTIAQKLTSLLGDPQGGSFGGSRQTREQIKRWDWNGHAILLAAPKDEYVAVRILPSDVADGTRKPRIPEAELREELATRIERRDNGDVVITTIPMVDQGPKGYCVPATWERVMRYMGIPADMYVLAMAGNTGVGGGTAISSIAAGAREIITRSGRRLDSSPSRISMPVIKKYIERGLPLMWTMYSMDDVNRDITRRSKNRAGMSSPEEWKESLADARKQARKIKVDRETGHVCMITGYNEATDEIAVSDSWGEAFAERWITLEEANAISQNNLMAINF
jgi:hypothetical protein